MFEELDKFKTMLNSELHDLAKRVSALEEENKILKEKVADLARSATRLK